MLTLNNRPPTLLLSVQEKYFFVFTSIAFFSLTTFVSSCFLRELLMNTNSDLANINSAILLNSGLLKILSTKRHIKK